MAGGLTKQISVDDHTLAVHELVKGHAPYLKVSYFFFRMEGAQAIQVQIRTWHSNDFFH